LPRGRADPEFANYIRSRGYDLRAAEEYRVLLDRAGFEVRLAEDRTAEVEGELTMRGVTRRVRAWGHWAAPRDAGYGEVAGLELHTTLDRREFGLHWQSQLPSGNDALGWEVEVDIDLLLIRTQEDHDVA
jgi:hypothetical protein